MRLNIRAKVILAVSFSLVAIFAVILYLLVTRNVTQLRTNLNVSSKSYASLATPPIGSTFLLYQNSGSIRITQQVNKFLELDPDVTGIRIVSVDGKQLYASNQTKSPMISSKLASAFQQQVVTNKNGYVTQVIQPYFEDSGAHRYSVVYDISSQRVERTVKEVVQVLIYAGIIILLVSIATTSWLLNRFFIRPLRDVSRSANKISSGDLSQQIVPKNKDEIGDLALSVNKMAESLKSDIVKLQEVDKLKSEFLMIASHNLRTPLTIMRGYIDLGESAQTVEQLKKIITSIQDSVVRLHLLSEDLLTISTLEAGGEDMKKTPSDAKTFIDSVVSEFQLLAEQKKLAWQFTNDTPEDAKLDLSQANMRSALGNLIDNAIKFTKEGGSVHISCKAIDSRLVFTVADTGIGISDQELPKLFTKFHRGTSTMTYDYEGVGIGLYLAKLIVEKHGGVVAVKSVVNKGSTFSVYLPLMTTQPEPTTNAEPSSPPAPAAHRPAA